MNIELLQSLITTVGFPIVAVVGLAWFIYRAFEKFTSQSENREDKLYEIISQAQETNERLSKTNSEFVAVLSTYKTDLDEIKEDISEIKENMKG